MSRIREALQKAEQDGSRTQAMVPATPQPRPAEENGRERRRVDPTPANVWASSIAARTTATPIKDSSFDIFEPLRILLRRRACLYVCMPALLAVAALVCILMPPKYVATSRLRLLYQQTGRLSVGEAASDPSDGFDFFATLQTDVTVMQSDTLALQVINELNLADTFEYNPLIKTAEVRRQMDLPIEQAPLKRAAILNRFRSNLHVDIVPGSRLITISYADSDPKLAAKIVNRLVSDFVEYDFQVRYNATVKATDFLSRQLVDLKAEVEKSQERVVELQKASGMFGADENHNIVATRLEQLNNEVVAAEANRVAKEAVYNLARNGNPELVAGLLGGSGTANSSGAQNSVVLNQNSSPMLNHLRQEQADLNVQYAQAVTQYGSAYPRVIQLKEQMSALESSIQEELVKIVGSAKSEYELAAAQESTAKKVFAEQQATASKMNDQAISYNIAKNEAESSRVLYNNLLQKLKEAGVLAGLRSSDLNIVDPATAPGRPSSPRVRLYLALGLLAGLVVGVACAFVLDAADRTIRNPEEIETTTQTPLLGMIPQAKIFPGIEPREWLKAYGPNASNGADHNIAQILTPDQSALAEAFRWARASLLLSQSGQTKVFMIVSAVSQEGKSFTALNLAAALAQNGTKVLLVDADLRRGTLSRVLKYDSGMGLTELLQGKIERAPYQQLDKVPGLVFMPAGALLNSPGELLASERSARIMEDWRREFSYVVIDTPPLLPLSDAVLLSPRVDSAILVARSSFTQRASVIRAIRLLRNARVKNICVLVNAVNPRSAEYSDHYGSYAYKGYQDKDPHLLVASSSQSSPTGERT